MNEQDNQKHKKTKFKLKIIGLVLLVCGAALSVAGMVDFFISFGGTEMPKLFWLSFIGLPLLSCGIYLTSLGFRREIASYMKNEAVPVINEAGTEIKPAVAAISAAVKSGTDGNKVCVCGTVNGQDSKFCKNCGKPLTCVCPHCGAEIDANSNFCDNCGKKI